MQTLGIPIPSGSEQALLDPIGLKLSSTWLGTTRMSFSLRFVHTVKGEGIGNDIKMTLNHVVTFALMLQKPAFSGYRPQTKFGAR